MASLVEIEGIDVRYGEIYALRDVSLTIAERLTVVLGVNGSGKSTLLKTIAGLIKPVKGVVRVLGLDPFRDIGAVSREIFYLYETETLPPDIRVSDAIASFRELYGGTDIDYLVDALGLGSHLYKRVGELSQGYRMRLHVLEALASRRRIILLDEPFRGIDRSTRRTVSELINNAARRGSAIIVATHILAELSPSKIVVLEDGRKVYEGSLRDYRFDGCALVECRDGVKRLCGVHDINEALSTGCRILSIIC